MAHYAAGILRSSMCQACTANTVMHVEELETEVHLDDMCTSAEVHLGGGAPRPQASAHIII